jgi:hypothetical protein
VRATVVDRPALPFGSASRRAHAALVVAVLLAGGIAHAEPDSRRTVGILDVRVEGVAPEAKLQFGAALEQQLATSHYTLLTQPKMHEAMASSAKFTEGCVVGACLMDIRAQTSAELVLLVAFNGSGTTYGYVVTLVRTDTGRVLSQHADRCDVCTLTEAMGKATKATLALLDAVPPQLPDESAAQRLALSAAIVPYQRDLADARRHPKRLGTGLTIAGGVITIVGIVALASSSTKPAVAITAGGAGLLLGGVTILAF